MNDKIDITTEPAGPLLAPGLPEFSRLPRAREREPITGASRGWLLDFDRELPAAEKFIVRAKRRGRARGVCFIDSGKLLTALRRLSAAEAVTK
jgi:hypothetical protein